jgi:hypothetical protein
MCDSGNLRVHPLKCAERVTCTSLSSVEEADTSCQFPDIKAAAQLVPDLVIDGTVMDSSERHPWISAQPLQCRAPVISQRTGKYFRGGVWPYGEGSPGAG